MIKFWSTLIFCTLCSTVIKCQTNIIHTGQDVAIDDLKESLKGYNAGTISLQQVGLEGRSNGQEFYVEIKDGKTKILYTTKNSLANAVYTLLDMWGFRWYGPGENWVIKPGKLVVKNVTATWVKPSFRNRDFFGTGGLSFCFTPTFDPNNNYAKNWYAWKRRNRYSSDFQAVGHTGNLFYTENKALLEKNADWFNGIQGMANGRIKIDNSKAVEAYKNWAIKRFADKKDFIVIGVDPEDGRGGKDDPLPANMKGIKNHADKWWWLANEVAKSFDEQDKKTIVTMYAYGEGNTNALTPSFTLRKNVYPYIIPYAFQHAYANPDNMVKAWSKKVTGNMGVYDYWNITQWSLGLPQFNFKGIEKRVKFWYDNKINGIYNETTDAAGAMGHIHWMMGQLQWNLNKNMEQLYTQYLNDCFGAAASEMRIMFDRWSTNYQNEAEAGLTYRNLYNAASMVTKGSSQWKRINELKAYHHFMKLMYAHNNTPQSKDAIIEYMYRIHHLMMVQTPAMACQNWILPTAGYSIPEGKNIRPITELEIEQQFEANKDLLNDVYAISACKFNFAKATFIEPIPNDQWAYGIYKSTYYFSAPVNTALNIQAGGAINNVTVSIKQNNTTVINDTVSSKKYSNADSIPQKNKYRYHLKSIKVPVAKGSVNELVIDGSYSRLKQIDKSVVLFKKPGVVDFDNYMYPVFYVYVPKDVNEIVFYDKEPEGTNGRGYLTDDAGIKHNRIKTQYKNIYKVKIPSGRSGKVWKVDFGHPEWKFLNIPNYVAMQRFGYVE
jgi:hypothetical protein